MRVWACVVRRQSIIRLAYHCLVVIQWLSGLAAIVVSSAVAVKIEDVQAWLPVALPTLKKIQDCSWFLTPILIGVFGFSQLVCRMIGPPWIWKAIRTLLDDLRNNAFGDKSNDPLHYHRATLFKHCRFRFTLRQWPWKGWLVPVERSGHTTLHSKTCFLAPNKADQAEGIAGQTWSRRKTLFIQNLPNLKSNPSDDNISKYARGSWVTEKWVRDHEHLTRSFCGLPVEVGNNLWGVIVLDSRDRNPIDRNAEKHYTSMKQLALLLRRR